MKKYFIAAALAICAFASYANAASDEAYKLVDHVSVVVAKQFISSQNLPDNPNQREKAFKAAQLVLTGAYNMGYNGANDGKTEAVVKRELYASVEKGFAGASVDDQFISFIEARAWEVARLGYAEAKAGL
ncbi:hypothetical protein [Herbiconiux daphne]|uniref:Uncharacterized protein n=1 Tax=Herbiconiux daphne TaxID=2970914 RepID=A0ABT2H9M1_9MICO|nr:hypothetical protein [Herbiconiux daphne]MCS5736660.1 hypothetical protein [Herbiconiux daphne]